MGVLDQTSVRLVVLAEIVFVDSDGANPVTLRLSDDLYADTVAGNVYYPAVLKMSSLEICRTSGTRLRGESSTRAITLEAFLSPAIETFIGAKICLNQAVTIRKGDPTIGSFEDHFSGIAGEHEETADGGIKIVVRGKESLLEKDLQPSSYLGLDRGLRLSPDDSTDANVNFGAAASGDYAMGTASTFVVSGIAGAASSATTQRLVRITENFELLLPNSSDVPGCTVWYGGVGSSQSAEISAGPDGATMAGKRFLFALRSQSLAFSLDLWLWDSAGTATKYSASFTLAGAKNTGAYASSDFDLGLTDECLATLFHLAYWQDQYRSDALLLRYAFRLLPDLDRPSTTIYLPFDERLGHVVSDPVHVISAQLENAAQFVTLNEGTYEQQGRRKPTCLGYVENRKPVLIDPVEQVYQVHDGEVQNIWPKSGGRRLSRPSSVTGNVQFYGDNRRIVATGGDSFSDFTRYQSVSVSGSTSNNNEFTLATEPVERGGNWEFRVEERVVDEGPVSCTVSSIISRRSENLLSKIDVSASGAFDFDPSTREITATGAQDLSDIDRYSSVVVAGSTNNDGTYTVVADPFQDGSSQWVIRVSEPLVTESAGSGVTITQGIDTAECSLDLANGRFTLKFEPRLPITFDAEGDSAVAEGYVEDVPRMIRRLIAIRGDSDSQALSVNDALVESLQQDIDDVTADVSQWLLANDELTSSTSNAFVGGDPRYLATDPFEFGATSAAGDRLEWNARKALIDGLQANSDRTVSGTVTVRNDSSVSATVILYIDDPTNGDQTVISSTAVAAGSTETLTAEGTLPNTTASLTGTSFDEWTIALSVTMAVGTGSCFIDDCRVGLKVDNDMFEDVTVPWKAGYYDDGSEQATLKEAVEGLAQGVGLHHSVNPRDGVLSLYRVPSFFSPLTPSWNAQKVLFSLSPEEVQPPRKQTVVRHRINTNPLEENEIDLVLVEARDHDAISRLQSPVAEARWPEGAVIDIEDPTLKLDVVNSPLVRSDDAEKLAERVWTQLSGQKNSAFVVEMPMLLQSADPLAAKITLTDAATALLASGPDAYVLCQTDRVDHSRATLFVPEPPPAAADPFRFADAYAASVKWEWIPEDLADDLTGTDIDSWTDIIASEVAAPLSSRPPTYVANAWNGFAGAIGGTTPGNLRYDGPNLTRPYWVFAVFLYTNNGSTQNVLNDAIRIDSSGDIINRLGASNGPSIASGTHGYSAGDLVICIVQNLTSGRSIHLATGESDTGATDGSAFADVEMISNSIGSNDYEGDGLLHVAVGEVELSASEITEALAAALEWYS